MLHNKNTTKVYIALFTAITLFNPLAVAALITWSGTNTTFPPTADQNWTVNTNWTGSVVPGSSDEARNKNSSILINSSVPDISTYLIGNNATTGQTQDLYIDNGGSLTCLSSAASAFRIYNTGGTQTVTLISGANLLVVGTLVNGSSTAGNAILRSAGNITAGTFSTQNGTSYLTGGNLTTTVGMTIGPGGGNVHLSGGSLSIDSGSTLELKEDSSLHISGGSLSSLNTNGLFFFRNVDDSTGPRIIHVDGSGASAITFGGLRYFQPEDQAGAVWRFTLDNTSNHITKIDFVGNGNAGGALRQGTLDINLRAGVLLTAGNTFDLVEAPTITSGADFTTTPTTLWDQTRVDLGNGNDALRITLKDADNKGTLTRGANLTFTASADGYVDLSGMESDESIYLLLDISGGTLSSFTDALTSANIIWQPGTQGYEVRLDLDKTTSGGNHFAWDFSEIDASMKLQAIKSHLKSRPLFSFQ